MSRGLGKLQLAILGALKAEGDHLEIMELEQRLGFRERVDTGGGWHYGKLYRALWALERRGYVRCVVWSRRQGYYTWKRLSERGGYARLRGPECKWELGDNPPPVSVEIAFSTFKQEQEQYRAAIRERFWRESPALAAAQLG